MVTDPHLQARLALGPKQHGMTDPHSPSVVVTLVINGNLPAPSSWSRCKASTIDTP